MNPIGIGWAGPTLLVAGTPEQQQRYLPGLLDGSEIWCQLFSEPEAGSDLASLRTTRGARRRRVRAQRPEDLDDARAVRPLRDPARPHRSRRRAAQGHHLLRARHAVAGDHDPPDQADGPRREFNEVFFDNVRIPAANVVGDENDGWRLAKVTLGNERVSLSGEGALWGIGPTAHDLLDLVRANGTVTDPVLRQRLAALYIESEILRLIRLRTVSAKVQGLEPGPEASVRKALADEHGQHVMAAGRRARGERRAAARPGPVRRRHADVGEGLPLQPRAHDRRRHQRGAAQHPRRAHPRPPPRPT